MRPTSTSYIVAIYRGADNAATASPVTTRDLDKPTPVAGEITVDISTLVNPLPAGSYKAVVRALGPGGTTASAPSATFDEVRLKVQGKVQRGSKFCLNPEP